MLAWWSNKESPICLVSIGVAKFLCFAPRYMTATDVSAEHFTQVPTPQLLFDMFITSNTYSYRSANERALFITRFYLTLRY